MIFGRKVVPTTLTQVPDSMRCAPGLLVLTELELNRVRSNDPNTIGELRRSIWRHERARLQQRLRELGCDVEAAL